MKIRLKETIISELTCLGLRPGMVVSGTGFNKITGAVDFTHYFNGAPYDCVVWPEDYEVVEKDKTTKVSETELPEIPKEITMPISEITNALDAMHWCFSPYLDNSNLSEFPWIVNLIKSYNEIAERLPSPWNLQYETIETF